MTDEEKMREQLAQDPKAYAFAIIAAVLQAVANLAAAVVLSTKLRRAVLDVITHLTEALTLLEFESVATYRDWVRRVNAARHNLSTFGAPPEVQPQLDLLAARLAEAVEVRME